MNEFLHKTVLVLAPHADDGEFGCGGTISRIVGEGGKVIYWAFSKAEISLPRGFTNADIIDELTGAMKTLGVSDYIISDYPTRRFSDHRQEILEEMVAFNRDLDTIIAPSRHDTHQDHTVIYCEAFRAFKGKNIISYEMPNNSVGFNEQMFVTLSKEDVDAKVRATACYKSQAHRCNSAEDFIRAQARFRGGQIKAEYAEVFEIVRWRV